VALAPPPPPLGSEADIVALAPPPPPFGSEADGVVLDDGVDFMVAVPEPDIKLSVVAGVGLLVGSAILFV
jgi:hypothetical protein